MKEAEFKYSLTVAMMVVEKKKRKNKVLMTVNS